MWNEIELKFTGALFRCAIHFHVDFARWIVWLCNGCDAAHSPSIRKWKRRRHTKKPNAIEDKSIWSQFALSLLSGIIFYWNWLLNATESHLRPSFIAISCAIFRSFFSGGCTFDSLAFRFTIPRFFGEPECASVCLKQTVCAILNCHFLGNAPMRCSRCPTDWYAATDNVTLFFVCTVGRFASRFFVSCALELKWNRNRLWCRCRPANAPRTNLVSRRFELFLFSLFFVYWNNYREFCARLECTMRRAQRATHQFELSRVAAVG